MNRIGLNVNPSSLEGQGGSQPVPPKEYPFPALDDERWTDTTISSTGMRSNIRSQPLIEPGNIVGTFGKNEEAEIIPSEAVLPNGDTFTWTPVILRDDTHGWMREDAFDVAPGLTRATFTIAYDPANPLHVAIYEAMARLAAELKV